MNVTNGNSKLLRIAFCVLGGLLLTPFLAQGASVSINLGQTAQNFTMAGLGPNAGGLGQYLITMGACTPAGGNTTCILSGAFTGSTSGFTSGTYSLATTYVGNGTTPLQGVQKFAGQDLFTFSSIPATTTMTLTLVTSNGTVVVPLFTGGQFVAGTAFSFVYSAGAICSGTAVANCSVGPVGLAAGAVISGRVTGSATFDQGNTYYFSDLAFKDGWQMTLTYNNYSPQVVTCVTNFYGDSGAPLPVPFSSGTVTTRTDVLQPGASIHDQTIANPAETVVQGWAQASCTGPVQASELFRLYKAGVPIGEASVNAETAPTTQFATFAQTSTGVAYANPSTTQSATVTFTVYNNAGTRLGSQNFTLGPLAHGSANVGPLLGLESFTGFVKITSTIPIISLSLNFEAPPIFSSLPPGDLPSSTVLVTP